MVSRHTKYTHTGEKNGRLVNSNGQFEVTQRVLYMLNACSQSMIPTPTFRCIVFGEASHACMHVQGRSMAPVRHQCVDHCPSSFMSASLNECCH